MNTQTPPALGAGDMGTTREVEYFLARGAQQRAKRQQARQQGEEREGGIAFGRHALDYKPEFQENARNNARAAGRDLLKPWVRHPHRWICGGRMKLLLVEDDRLLGDGIRAGLMQGGFTVDWVRDGVEAELALRAESYAAIVLDLGLPRMSGLDLLRRVRAARNAVPVLVLTARDAIDDRILGLDSGADDYMVKPFDLAELQARLRALVRRSRGQASPLLTHGNVELDPVAHRVTCEGREVELTAREFAVLHALLLNRGRVLSREQIEQQLYGWGDEVESNAIEVFVHHLRRKLPGGLIRTVRGVGYVIGDEAP